MRRKSDQSREKAYPKPILDFSTVFWWIYDRWGLQNGALEPQCSLKNRLFYYISAKTRFLDRKSVLWQLWCHFGSILATKMVPKRYPAPQKWPSKVDWIFVCVLVASRPVSGPKWSPKWPPKSDKINRHFHIGWVLDAFFGFSMRTRHLPSLFYRFWHAFRQVFLKALRKTLARTSREPAKNLASTYDYCRTPSFKTGAAVLRPWAAFNTICYSFRCSRYVPV